MHDKHRSSSTTHNISVLRNNPQWKYILVFQHNEGLNSIERPLTSLNYDYCMGKHHTVIHPVQQHTSPIYSWTNFMFWVSDHRGDVSRDYCEIVRILVPKTMSFIVSHVNPSSAGPVYMEPNSVNTVSADDQAVRYSYCFTNTDYL